jgi:hypothetical protein
VSLPDDIDLVDPAKREIAKLKDPAAAASLLEALVRRSKDQHLPREDEALPLGKGRSLRSIRITYARSEYRLIYMLVRHSEKTPQEKGERIVVAAVRRPIRFVGLLAWRKNQPKVGARGNTAWTRSEEWLADNPNYRRT